MKAASFALSLLLAPAAPVLDAQAKVARPRSAPNLFTYPVGALRANRVFCFVSNNGLSCHDFGEAIFGGGFWPQGTADQYIFQAGLQIAGMIPVSAGGGQPAFPWAGDTVGAYFYDSRGTQLHGDPLADVFNSLDTADVARWPNGGVVRDAAVFDASYLGRTAVADQDLWTRYWDGSPLFLGGRTHPMGIAVDQRALAWNDPGGNADIIYFVVTLYNVTARDPAAYANASIPPAVQNEIAALGARFQDLSEAKFAMALPDGGWALESLYVGLGMDPDVGDASSNSATAVLPLGAAVAYKSNFREGSWTFPPEVFGAPPFAPAPGFVATTFPRRPADIAIFSTFTGAPSGHADPVGVSQLWRYLSGVVDPSRGDAPCTTPVPRERHFCFLDQTARDARMESSFGPFALAPGAATTFVVAYLFAAPVDTVNAYVGTNLAPGVPFTGDSIAADTTRLRPIDRIAGWLTQNDANANGTIEMNEVTTARRSLLHKAQLAQAFVDHKFLTPSAPAAPGFFLVPGDNQVTVVWQPSATETTGDPYFQVAADPTAVLYDPNFRRFDVEGYRIYRGRDPRALELIAQVDFDTTAFVDYLGAVSQTYGNPNCVPELGVTSGCPVPFGPTPDTAVHNDLAIRGQLVQYPEGGRILSTNGLVTVVRADTFPRGPEYFAGLNDTGVRFVYEDQAVTNSFTYYYAVTAFDYNSIRSGPTSLESPRYVKRIAPRVSSGQEVAGRVNPLQLLGADSSVLNPAAAVPAIDAATGTFSGPMPPTDGFALAFDAFVSQLVSDGKVRVRIDSILPGVADGLAPVGRPASYFVHVTGPGVNDSAVVPVRVDAISTTHRTQMPLPGVAVDSAQAARFAGDAVAAVFQARATLTVPGTWRTASWGRADLNADPPNSPHNGPRWWSGSANENTAAPNQLVCTPAATSCIQANLSRNAGSLPFIDTLFHLQSYSTVPNTPMRELEAVGATVYRAADMQVYWGSGGAVDSVVDVTHRVRVPFSPKLRASWGFLNDSSFVLGGTNALLTADSNNARLTWTDAFCVDPVPTYLNVCGGVAQSPAVLQNHARQSAVAARASAYGSAATLPTTGSGFLLYLNGHFFLMQGAVPGQGTVWIVRFYAGTVTGTPGTYAYRTEVRPPAVPGLRADLVYQGSSFTPTVTNDSVLRRVHTVPDPFYVASGYELSPDTLALKFVHLPARAIVRIYSLSGILVAVLVQNDPTGGGEATWDLTSRTGRRVASGVYFYHIETPDHRQRVGRFTVITGPNRGP